MKQRKKKQPRRPTVYSSPYNPEDYVTIRASREEWERIGRNGRALMKEGAERIAAMHRDMALASPVRYMPPVRCFPTIWAAENGDALAYVPGCSAPVEYGDVLTFGARLSAQASVSTRVGVVRSILVHEFAHCFHAMAEAIRCVDEGIPRLGPSGSPFDTAQDDERLGNPEDWFGEADAKLLIHQHDASMNVLEENLSSLCKVFRVAMPEMRYHITKFWIPDAVQERARQLRLAQVVT